MNKNQDVILVTGATGKQGGAVARQLLQRGLKVKALTRKPDSDAAKALGKLGAQVIQGDFDDAASLQRALKGAWGVFAMQNTWEAGVEKEEQQGKRLAEVARAAGVHHYVYTSVGSAHWRTGIPHFDNKWRVEEKVRGLGFPSWTILRPVFFMENFASPMLKGALLDGKLMFGLQAETPLQMVAVEDIGKIGAKVLEQHDAYNHRELDLAGDERTLTEAAAIFAKTLGRPVQLVSLPVAEIRKQSEDYAIMLEWFERVGYSVHLRALANDQGFKLQTLADWAPKANWK